MKTRKIFLFAFYLLILIGVGIGCFCLYRQQALEEELLTLIQKGTLVEIQHILMEEKPNLSFKDKSGDTPLDTAICLKKYSIAIELLKHGANPNLLSSNDKISVSPLYHACFNDNFNLNLVAELINQGANVNQGTTLDGNIEETPLMLACIQGNLPAITILLDHHADVNIKNASGNSALTFTIISHDYKTVDAKVQVIKLLMSHGAIFDGNRLTAVSKITMREFVGKKIGPEVLKVLESGNQASTDVKNP